jgi:hypothetical protein
MDTAFGNFQCYFLYLQMYFCGWVRHAAAQACFPRKKSGIQVLAGLAPSSQRVASLLRTQWLAVKVAKLYINEIQFGNFFRQ